MAEELKKLQDAQTAQGEVVRKLKAEKADKAKIDVEVKKLLDLKDQVTKKAAALGVTVEAPKPAAPAAKPAAAAPAPKKEEPKKDAPKKEEKPKEEKPKKETKEERKAAKQEQHSGTKETKSTTTTTSTESSGEHLNLSKEGVFGRLPLIQSKDRPGKVFTSVSDLHEKVDQTVWVRARVHISRLQGAKLGFVLLRQRLASVQGVLFVADQIPQEMNQFLGSIPRESIVDVEAVVSKPQKPIESATQKNVELQIKKLFLVSQSLSTLPLQVEDAGRSEALIAARDQEEQALVAKITQLESKANPSPAEKDQLQKLKAERETFKKYVRVEQNTRLDNRILDLRTQANQGIFRIQSGVCALFREFLLANNFTEIHSPKILGAASEGGAEVFRVDYFGQPAFLAQSPQLYKQMAICADMERVFEIGPIFRAEKAHTHRHLTEFVGLDLEMTFNEHYHEVLDVLDAMFNCIFDGLNTRFRKEIEVIRQQFPFEPLEYTYPSLRLTFPDAVKLLKEDGVIVPDLEDLSTENERKLGAIVKRKYKTDFYILDKFPASARPFYTMPDPSNPNYTNSYDLFIRGQEIVSGSQRIHIPELLRERALAKGVAPDSIKDYIRSFEFGAPPHGGGGVGLERVVFLFLGLKDIRQSSMFPRDVERVAP